MRTRGWFACTFAASVGLAAVFTGGPELRVGHPSGLDFVQQNSPTSKKYLIETMCGGVALFDYNNDGLLDVFFVNGGHVDDPVKCPARFSRRDPAYWNRLYRQNKDGHFLDEVTTVDLDVQFAQGRLDARDGEVHTGHILRPTD